MCVLRTCSRQDERGDSDIRKLNRQMQGENVLHCSVETCL